jgi:hypothetical protein
VTNVAASLLRVNGFPHLVGWAARTFHAVGLEAPKISALLSTLRIAFFESPGLGTSRSIDSSAAKCLPCLPVELLPSMTQNGAVDATRPSASSGGGCIGLAGHAGNGGDRASQLAKRLDEMSPVLFVALRGVKSGFVV